MILLIFAAAPGIMDGQTCPPRPLIVSAFDVHGLPIKDLTAENFRASYRNQPLNILSASFREDPTVRTVVLLNTSVGMSGAGSQGGNKWKIARSAALEFILASPPQAAVSLFAFSDGVIRHGFQSSGGRQPMMAWLTNWETLKGRPAVLQTVSKILEAMEPTHPGDAIYLVTSSEQEIDSAAVVSAAADKLQSSGVRLFSFLLNDLGSGLHTSAQENIDELAPRPHMGSGEVGDLVESSGGSGFIWFPGVRSRTGLSFSASSFDYDEHTLEAIRKISRVIEDAVSNFYILTVGPHKDSHMSEEWKLETIDANGKKRKDVTLAYPGRLTGCTVEPAGH